MLKTTKEFDFVYKNSYKFRAETLDICVLKPNLTEQFFARFRRLPCNVVGFSVSKKVGIAVERNLVKRRLRAICREFFCLGNSSLGMQFRTCGNFGDFADSKSSLNPQNSHKYKSHTANTRIVKYENAEYKNDLRGSILEIKSGFCETSNEDKTNSLSRKRVEAIHDFSPKDKHANLICIFIAKSQILQTPFYTLKDSIFATLKRQLNFKKNSHTSPRNFSANRPQTKAKQNENR